jgi:tRNA(adenine34) deaminase
MSADSDDSVWMRIALQQAALAGDAGDVPVGAVVVLDNQVIGVGRNRREIDGDPTAHAEIIALRSAAVHLRMWRVEATLYVTQEPCSMCAGALVNARVRRLVYGCSNPKAGAVNSLFRLCSDPRLNHQIEIDSGILEHECSQYVKDFFSALRKGPRYKAT